MNYTVAKNLTDPITKRTFFDHAFDEKTKQNKKNRAISLKDAC